MRVEETIREKLRGAFAPAEIEVVNDSHHHAGHRSSPGTGESHFSVTVVSAAFAGKSRLERHRMVNAALAEELGIEPARFHSSDDRKEIELRAVWPDAETARRDTEILGELVALVRDQKLRVLVSGFYPYGFVQDAFDDLEKRHSRGKIVLGMNPVDAGRVTKARDIHEAGA